MAFEAGIAAGPGVVVVTGGAANADAISAAVRRGCRGIVSFGIAGGLTPDLEPGACIVAQVYCHRRSEIPFPPRMV